MKHGVILFVAGLILSQPAMAFDWNGALKDAMGKASGSGQTAGTSSTSAVDALSNKEINAGLKEALTLGADGAVAQLGVKNGFYGNPALRIPLPKSLQKVDKAMRMFGMEKQSDELILAMNRAAEAAVPQAQTLLVNAVKNMTLDDARGILTGGPTSATDFFRAKTETQLTERFSPIVKAVTDKTSLAQQYNRYAGQASQFGLVDKNQASVEQYVTQQSLDRLYLLIGEKEQAIRANPMQAGSDLLKQVFGAVK
jgi:hypothetical protein